MDLDELVIRIQVAADGVEETLARVADGVRAVAEKSDAAAGRWETLSTQARNYANACATVETAMARVQAALSQADDALERGFDKAKASVQGVMEQLTAMETQLVNLPEGQLRLDSGPAMQAISGVMNAWNSACAAMSAQASALRTVQAMQSVHLDTTSESPGDTWQRMEQVNIALGRMMN